MEFLKKNVHSHFRNFVKNPFPSMLQHMNTLWFSNYEQECLVLRTIQFHSDNFNFEFIQYYNETHCRVFVLNTVVYRFLY